MTLRILAVALFASLACVSSARAQSFTAEVHFSSAGWSEFDGNDYGVGGRVTWQPSSMVGLDADVTWYPSDFPDRIAFTRSRFEGLFGATVGPRLNRVRPFAKAAAGFLDVGATPGAFACILIFPPPLNCALASGATLPAIEVGGGVEVSTGSRMFVRGDVGYRLLKYPGPAFDSDFQVRDDGWWGGAVRVTLGAGLRF